MFLENKMFLEIKCFFECFNFVKVLRPWRLPFLPNRTQTRGSGGTWIVTPIGHFAPPTSACTWCEPNHYNKRTCAPALVQTAWPACHIAWSTHGWLVSFPQGIWRISCPPSLFPFTQFFPSLQSCRPKKCLCRHPQTSSWLWSFGCEFEAMPSAFI